MTQARSDAVIATLPRFTRDRVLTGGDAAYAEDVKSYRDTEARRDPRASAFET